MRKICLILLIVLFGLCLIQTMSKEEEIRVRIIPNSDEKEDLVLKQTAKEYVICYLKKAYSDDYDLFVKNINASYKQLELLLENVLDTDCTINFDNHTFYNKTYNNSAVKNENTMTLYVVLGNGEGSNWWGTVYPDFLEISSSEEVEYESLIVQMFQKIRGD